MAYHNGSMYRLSARVVHVLCDADRAALRFGRRAALFCPPDCGDCCRTGQPEASPLSLLPLALHALDSGLAEAWLEQTDHDPQTPCMFYDEQNARHCRVYPYRPLLCRLFGFAGRLDKNGNPEFRPCHRLSHTKTPPHPRPPLYSAWHLRLQTLYPPLGEIMPLHTALRHALLWVLLHHALEPPRRPRGSRAA